NLLKLRSAYDSILLGHGISFLVLLNRLFCLTKEYHDLSFLQNFSDTTQKNPNAREQGARPNSTIPSLMSHSVVRSHT
ncbi:MAG: hypothetical protein KJ626_03595, partial [Verrucomicrobia bacterium]|nr:hypothetical protein [Verrucomicrobiota bacterium]